MWFRPGYSKELDGRVLQCGGPSGGIPRSDGADSQRRDEVFQKPTIRRSGRDGTCRLTGTVRI